MKKLVSLIVALVLTTSCAFATTTTTTTTSTTTRSFASAVASTIRSVTGTVTQTINSMFSLANVNINIGTLYTTSSCSSASASTKTTTTTTTTVVEEPPVVEEHGTLYWIYLHTCDITVYKLNVHESADLASKRIGVVEEGAVVEVLEYAHGMVRIKFGGSYGWICADNITRDASLSTLRYDVSIAGETLYVYNRKYFTITNALTGEKRKLTEEIEVIGYSRSFGTTYFEWESEIWFTGSGNVHSEHQPEVATEHVCSSIYRNGQGVICTCGQ